jgi:hypothetical protein
MNMRGKSGSEQAAAEPYLGVTNAIHSSAPLEKSMIGSRQENPLMKRFMRWLVPDRRVANRHTMPPVIAYLGLAQTSKEYKIGDISVAGFYMITEERWIPKSGFPVTLERTDDAAQGRTLTAYCTVVRTGLDGVAFSFLEPPEEDHFAGEARAIARIDLTKLAHFLKGLPLSDPDSAALENAS